MEIEKLKPEATDSSDSHNKHPEIPLWTGVFLMINSIVGGGIVEVPLSFYNLGVAGGESFPLIRNRTEYSCGLRGALLDLAAPTKQEHLWQAVISPELRSYS